MVVDLINLAIINQTIIDTTNTSAAEMEEDEDLLADLGDLDKTISIIFTIEDIGKGLFALSEPEIQRFPAKESFAALTTPSSTVNLNIFTLLVHQVQELLNHQLEVLVIDEGLQQNLFGIHQQFKAIEILEALVGQIIVLHDFHKSLCHTSQCSKCHFFTPKIGGCSKQN